MDGKIFKIDDNDELVEFGEEKHKNENDFQRLIAKYPDLIPGDQIDFDNPRKWIFVGREIKNIDVLLLDQDGIPTIVEVKKVDNNEIHRLVTAQMLDYGSNLFLHDVGQIRQNINKYSPIKLQDFLGDDTSEETFLEKVKKNIEEEKMRLIVVSDAIPRNLQNIVEFLNNNMDSVDVFAVEIKQYFDETGKKVLVPRLASQSREIMFFEPKLEEKTLYENLDENGVGEEFYRELIEFADENNFEKKWTKTGFFLTVPLEEGEVKVLHCYSDKYSFGQNIFSTHAHITAEVEGGDEIFQKYFDDVLELGDFKRVDRNFNLKIDKNLDENQWNEFKRLLIELKDEIKMNGLVNESNR